MPVKKAKAYDEMTLEELTAAAAGHVSRVRELRDTITDDMSAAERLPIEEEIARSRAHLNVINPLRTEKSVQEELSRSDMVRRMRGMSQPEWDRLRQVIGDSDPVVATELHAPKAGERR